MCGNGDWQRYLYLFHCEIVIKKKKERKKAIIDSVWCTHSLILHYSCWLEVCELYSYIHINRNEIIHVYWPTVKHTYFEDILYIFALWIMNDRRYSSDEITRERGRKKGTKTSKYVERNEGSKCMWGVFSRRCYENCYDLRDTTNVRNNVSSSTNIAGRQSPTVDKALPLI